jgi:hypothetical protein
MPWEAPTDPAKWKGEYVVICMIALYGTIGYTGTLTWNHLISITIILVFVLSA